jgi:ABC-type methionine transport system permease subunit
MIFTVALMVFFVQIFQFTGNRVVRALDKRA